MISSPPRQWSKSARTREIGDRAWMAWGVKFELGFLIDSVANSLISCGRSPWGQVIILWR